MKQPSLPLSRQKFHLIKPNSSANEGASECHPNSPATIPNSPVESSNFHRKNIPQLLRKESFFTSPLELELLLMDRPYEPLIEIMQPAAQQQSADDHQPWDDDAALSSSSSSSSFHHQQQKKKVDDLIISKRKITALHHHSASSLAAGCCCCFEDEEELGKKLGKKKHPKPPPPRFPCRFQLCNQTFSTSGHLTRQGEILYIYIIVDT